ncbi:MAG TPA: phosphatidylinositol mannoside acyltransferase [Actinomycetota bacterium]|nr:phosphatidylinositol mannoside acyltransferase [Actinomycetota bacterium]
MPGPGPELWGQLADLRSVLSLRATQWLGMRLPRPVGLRAAELYHRLSYPASRAQRAVVARNLARVLGRPPGDPLVQRATRECFRLYAQYWYETFALRTMTPEEVDRRFRVQGIEHVDRALEEGKGVVLALPHMGNWDAAGHWLCLHGYRVTAVAEALRPREVFELFYRHRRALGLDIVPLVPGVRVSDVLAERLARNHVVALVADRDLTGRGVAVEMFGAPRRLPSGPARLALATGAPLSTCSVYTAPDGWRCVIAPPLEVERSGDLREDVARLTRSIARDFERFIAAAPADWHMFQPAWDGEPSR